MGKIIALTGAKGGCGNTSLTAALGRALAERGKTVCLVDGCIGLRGLDIALGVQDRVVFDLADLSEELCTMEQALVELDFPGFYFVSAPQMEPEEKRLFKGPLSRLVKRFDWILVDAPSAMSSWGTEICALADRIILTSRPGDMAARNAERISSLLRERAEAPIDLAINFYSARQAAAGEAAAPDAVAAYLDLPLLGLIPQYGQNGPDVFPEKALPYVREMAARLAGEDIPLTIPRERRFSWLS